jgi:hypothetical protein
VRLFSRDALRPEDGERAGRSTSGARTAHAIRPLKQINASNLSKIEVAWNYQVAERGRMQKEQKRRSIRSFHLRVRTSLDEVTHDLYLPGAGGEQQRRLALPAAAAPRGPQHWPRSSGHSYPPHAREVRSLILKSPAQGSRSTCRSKSRTLPQWRQLQGAARC